MLCLYSVSLQSINARKGPSEVLTSCSYEHLLGGKPFIPFNSSHPIPSEVYRRCSTHITECNLQIESKNKSPTSYTVNQSSQQYIAPVQTPVGRRDVPPAQLQQQQQQQQQQQPQGNNQYNAPRSNPYGSGGRNVPVSTGSTYAAPRNNLSNSNNSSYNSRDSQNRSRSRSRSPVNRGRDNRPGSGSGGSRRSRPVIYALFV